MLGKDPVKAVEMPLVLDEREPRKPIEVLGRTARHARLERLQQ
jgi:hypothetical protein